MFQPTLLVAGLVALTVASVYAYVAGRLGDRRPASLPERRAVDHFILWWCATALNIFLGGLLYVAASFGWTDFSTQLTYAIFQRLLLAVSLYGLIVYLMFLLSGRSWNRAVGALYFVTFVLLVYTVLSAQPAGVHVGDWRTDLEYATEAPAVVRVLNLALVTVPPVLLSMAGLVVAIRPGPLLPALQRYRLALVCGALVVWWIIAVIAGQREALGQEWYQVINRFVGLAAALLVLAAFRPPAALRRRLGAPRPTARPAHVGP